MNNLKHHLYIDLGNSTADLLIRIGDSTAFFKVRSPEFEGLKEILTPYLPLDYAYVSSVDHVALEGLLDKLLEIQDDLPVQFLKPCVKKEVSDTLGIRIDNLDILGTDLFLDLVSRENKKGQIIVDLGTAGKILYLGKDNVFYGCQIFPGIRKFPLFLSKTTDLLKEQPILPNPPLISLATAECISSGVIHGACALIAGMVKRIEEEYQNPEAEVILTGGDAKLIKDELPNYLDKNFIYDELHVLKGFWRIEEIRKEQQK